MKDSIDREKATGSWLCSILKSVFESESERRSVLLDSLRPLGLYSPWNSPDQNTGIGSLSLFKAMFATQGLNPGLRAFQAGSFSTEPQRSPNLCLLIHNLTMCTLQGKSFSADLTDSIDLTWVA